MAFGGGGLGGEKFKSLAKLPNGWVDFDKIWHTFADSSARNGHRPEGYKKLPLDTPGEGEFVVFRGYKIQK